MKQSVFIVKEKVFTLQIIIPHLFVRTTAEKSHTIFLVLLSHTTDMISVSPGFVYNTWYAYFCVWFVLL